MLNLVVAVVHCITYNLYSIIVHSDLGSIFEAFVPPEGDGIASLLSGKVNNLCASAHSHNTHTHSGFYRHFLGESV